MPLHVVSMKAMVVFSNELHRRYGDQGIISVSLHPGNLKTDLQRHVSSLEKVLSVCRRCWLVLVGIGHSIYKLSIQAPLLHPASMGALTQLWAGTSPDGLQLGGEVSTSDMELHLVLRICGQYLIPWARLGSAREETQDAQLGKRLWAWMENATRDM